MFEHHPFIPLAAMLRKLLAIGLLVLSCCANAGDATIEVARFLHIGGRAEHGLKQRLVQLRQTAPEAAIAVAAAYEAFDQDEIARRYGRLFDEVLSPNDVDFVLRFSQTPAGKVYGAAYRDYQDPDALEAYLGKLSGDERTGAIGFERSPAYLKVIDVMTSERARRMVRDYAEELMCSYYKKGDRSAVETLNSKGKCL